MRRLIAEDPAMRALADELRATNTGLDTLLDDVAAVEVPGRLVTLIQGHRASDVAVVEPTSSEKDSTAADEAPDDGDVIALRQPVPVPRRVSYGPLAAAASIALLISSGALFHLYNTSNSERTRMQAVLATAKEEVESRGRALADANAELSRLAGLAEQASSQRRETADRLIANEESAQQLEVERAALEGRYAALESQNERLNQRLTRRRAEVAESETARDQISADLADARQALAEMETEAGSTRQALTAEVQDLTAKLDLHKNQMASLAEELEAGEKRSETANTNLAKIRSEQTALQRQLAAAELEREQLQAERQACRAGG